MIEVEHHESINRPPALVFAAGLDTNTWPQLDRLSLQARQALLAHDANIDAVFSELGLHIGLACGVTELEPERRLVIEGESNQARLLLGLDFAPADDAETTTAVDVLLQIELRSFLVRRTLGKAAAHIARGNVKDFAEGFKANVEKLPDNYAELRVPYAS